jgi:hypothetical protein
MSSSAVRSGSRVAAICAAVTLLGGWPGVSHSAFIPISGLGSQSPAAFASGWLWDFTSAGPNNPSTIEGPNWLREVQSSAGAGVQNLNARIRHLAPPPDAGDAPQNPAPPGTNGLNINNLSRPAGTATTERVVAKQFTHPGLGHFDLIRLSIRVGSVGNANVVATGRHSRNALAQWSYTPLQAGKITVQASYDQGDNNTVEPGRNVEPRIIGPGQGGFPFVKLASETGTLMVPGEPRRPTDYVVRFTSNPTGELTLAFIGEVDDVPGKLDLAAAFDFFLPLTEIIAPLFVDAAGADLFAAVDLVQWLSLASPADLVSTFSITQGTNAALPGYLFSTSPIGFDAAVGFTTSTPFTGDVHVAGLVDGRIPEPSTMMLLGTGGVGVLAYASRRLLLRGWTRSLAGP